MPTDSPCPLGCGLSGLHDTLTDGESVETFRARALLLKEKHGNGNGVGTPLSIAAQEAMAMWPTPRASPNENRQTSPSQVAGEHGLNLAMVAASRLCPTATATATDAKASGSAGYGTESGRSAGVTLTDAACRGLLAPTTQPGGARTSTGGRVLNPRFVEALIGWPPGWTDCGCSATESSPTRPPSRSGSSQSVCLGNTAALAAEGKDEGEAT